MKKPLGNMDLKTFSCGEQYVRINESVRDKSAFIIQTCREKFVDLDFAQTFLIADAANNADASDVWAVLPQFGYARQDKIDKREPISARLMANLLKASGVNHMITCQLHSDQIQGMFGFPVYNLKTYDLFADHIKKLNLENAVVVSTDAGGVKNAKELSSRLGTDLAILHKERPGHNKAEITHVVGDVRGTICILFDDMIDTGGTINGAVNALIKKGAIPDEIIICATHAVLSGPAVERLVKANLKRVIVTDTMPLGPEKQFKGLEVISVAPMFAGTINKVTQGPSR